jgi:hypothetical protein
VPEETEKLPEDPNPEPPRYRELIGRERIGRERSIAAGAGLLILVAGFLVLFLAKNDGAVAVAVAFAVGALLVVVAVQRTPLIKLGSDKVSVELAGRAAAMSATVHHVADQHEHEPLLVRA